MHGLQETKVTWEDLSGKEGIKAAAGRRTWRVYNLWYLHEAEWGGILRIWGESLETEWGKVSKYRSEDAAKDQGKCYQKLESIVEENTDNSINELSHQKLILSLLKHAMVLAWWCLSNDINLTFIMLSYLFIFLNFWWDHQKNMKHFSLKYCETFL